jgi:hypothetical protein
MYGNAITCEVSTDHHEGTYAICEKQHFNHRTHILPISHLPPRLHGGNLFPASVDPQSIVISLSGNNYSACAISHGYEQ